MTLTATKPDVSLTKRLFDWWKSDQAENYNPKQAAEILVGTLTDEELKWVARQWIAGVLSKVERSITVKNEKASIIKFKEFVPDPFVAASGIPKAQPKGIAAEEKAAAEEAAVLSQKELMWALEKSVTAISENYQDKIKLQISAELLASTIELMDGTEKPLGEVTVQEWKSRIKTREAVVVGNVASIGRERKYVELCEEAGVDKLNDLF